MPARLRLLVPITVLLIAALAGYAYVHRQGQADPNVIPVSGNIEVIDAEISFKIPGRVIRRAVDEGELVQQGADIAELDDSDQRADVDMRTADVAAAEAALAELEAGSRPEEIAAAAAALSKAQAFLKELETGSRPQEIAAAEATVARAKAELADAEANYRRVAELHARQMSAQQEYDSATAQLKVAQARLDEAVEHLKLTREGTRTEQIDQARAALAQTQANYELVKQGPRQETIAQAHAKLALAKANLALAETRLGYTHVASPLNGVVLSKNIEPGEYVSAGTPVVTVGDLEHVWLRAYINETDLGRVKVGQAARVTTDTYPGRVYEGRVGFIASQAEFTPRSVQTAKERVKLVYRIKIDIENPKMELKPGMPADAEILTDGGK